MKIGAKLAKTDESTNLFTVDFFTIYSLKIVVATILLVATTIYFILSMSTRCVHQAIFVDACNLRCICM